MSRRYMGDPITKSATGFHDEPGGGFVIEHLQDVEPVTELTKEEFKVYDERARWDATFNKVASIPNVIYWSWTPEQRRDPEFIRAWINNPDNRAFRTRPGRV